MEAAGLAAAPIVLRDGTYLGAFSPDPSSDDEASISRLASVAHAEVPVDAMLDAAADVFATDDVGWVPVLDADRKLVGIVTVAGLVGAYRDALGRSVAALGDVLGATRLVDGTVAVDSPLAGLTISELPRGAAVISLERNGALLEPQPDLALEIGDTLSILASEASVDRLEGLLDLAQADETAWKKGPTKADGARKTLTPRRSFSSMSPGWLCSSARHPGSRHDEPGFRFS